MNGLAGRVNALLYGKSGFSNGHLYDRVAPGAEGMWPMGPQLFQKWRLSGEAQHLHVNESWFNPFFCFIIIF